MYRPKPSGEWQSCYLVEGGRARAIESARQIVRQERSMGGRGQAGIMAEDAHKVTIIREESEEY
jgi:hypothetical protein